MSSVIFLVLAILAAGASPSTAPSAVVKTNGEAFAEILGVKHRDRPFEPPLADAIADLRAGKRVTFMHVERLVRVLSEGVDSTAYRAVVLEDVTPSIELPENERFGTPGTRCNIADSLWSNAKQLDKAGKANAAAAFARAAVLLAANEGFYLGDATAGGILRKPDYARIAQLDDARWKGLIAIVDISTRLGDDFYRGGYKDANMLAATWMRGVQNTRAGENVAALQKHLRAAWQQAGQSDQFRHRVTQLMWQVECLARADKDAELEKMLQELSSELAASEPDPIIKRWLHEAMTEEGPRPKGPMFAYVRGDNLP